MKYMYVYIHKCFIYIDVNVLHFYTYETSLSFKRSFYIDISINQVTLNLCIGK